MNERRAYRRKLPHIQEAARSYFVTFRTKNRWRLPSCARTIALECCVHIHERSAILHGAVVMPDHVHLVLTPLVNEDGGTHPLERIMQGLKGTSARRINTRPRRKGTVWDSESFDHLLRSDEWAEAKAAYVCENPVRAGLATVCDEYEWLWRLPVEESRS